MHLGKISLQLRTFFFLFSPSFSKLSVFASVFCEERIRMSVWQQRQRRVLPLCLPHSCHPRHSGASAVSPPWWHPVMRSEAEGSAASFHGADWNSNRQQ